jgi:hypothetical protein
MVVGSSPLMLCDKSRCIVVAMLYAVIDIMVSCFRVFFGDLLFTYVCSNNKRLGMECMHEPLRICSAIESASIEVALPNVRL